MRNFAIVLGACSKVFRSYRDWKAGCLPSVSLPNEKSNKKDKFYGFTESALLSLNDLGEHSNFLILLNQNSDFKLWVILK